MIYLSKRNHSQVRIRIVKILILDLRFMISLIKYSFKILTQLNLLFIILIPYLKSSKLQSLKINNTIRINDIWEHLMKMEIIITVKKIILYIYLLWPIISKFLQYIKIIWKNQRLMILIFVSREVLKMKNGNIHVSKPMLKMGRDMLSVIRVNAMILKRYH
jgi:hypothetical protein